MNIRGKVVREVPYLGGPIVVVAGEAVYVVPQASPEATRDLVRAAVDSAAARRARAPASPVISCV